MPDTPLICHECFKAGWSWEPCPHTMQIVNANAEKVKALELQIDAEKKLYTSNDSYLRAELKKTEGAYTVVAAERDVALRLNGEYRKALEQIASMPVAPSELNGLVHVMKQKAKIILRESEKRL